MNRECAAEILLSKHVHHYPFIRMYCLFTVAPFPKSPKAGRWSGKPEQKPFFPTRLGLRNAHHSAGTESFTGLLAAHEWQLNYQELFQSTRAGWLHCKNIFCCLNSNLLIVKKNARKLTNIWCCLFVCSFDFCEKIKEYKFLNSTFPLTFLFII